MIQDETNLCFVVAQSVRPWRCAASIASLAAAKMRASSIRLLSFLHQLDEQGSALTMRVRFLVFAVAFMIVVAANHRKHFLKTHFAISFLTRATASFFCATTSLQWERRSSRNSKSVSDRHLVAQNMPTSREGTPWRNASPLGQRLARLRRREGHGSVRATESLTTSDLSLRGSTAR